MEKRPAEDLLCFVCDNPLLVLFLVLLLGFGLMRLWPGGAAAGPSLSQTPVFGAATPLSASPLPTTAEITPAGESSPLPSESPSGQTSPTPAQPVFRIVFVPLNWQGNLAGFRVSAQIQAQTFAKEAGLPASRFEVVLSEYAMTNQDLTDPALVDLVQAFALEHEMEAERYVGLTNADLAPEGLSGVVGWTSSGLSLVVEAQDPYVTAHELGHTFGLCDEYNYADWSRQNREYAGGCPNPYPNNCEQTMAQGVTCNGAPAQDGSNSIMGPAGLLGEYSYNEASLRHLQAQLLEWQP